MTEINLPPLPEMGSEWANHWTKVVHEKMQAYARQAIEADRAQRGVPEVLALAKSMLEGWVDGFVDCIEGEEADEMVLASRSTIEKLGSLIAAAPTASQQAAKCYVHQVPDHCDRITWRGGYYLLENLTSTATAPTAPQAQPTAQAAPQQERKPLNYEECREFIETHAEYNIAGWRVWGLNNLMEFIGKVERHHGISASNGKGEQQS